jgi:hypothetical protein
LRSIMTSTYISQHAQLWLTCASLSSLNLRLPVHLQIRLITAPKCISEWTQSQSPSASPNMLDHGLQAQL